MKDISMLKSLGEYTKKTFKAKELQPEVFLHPQKQRYFSPIRAILSLTGAIYKEAWVVDEGE